jgi:hypothetical protein
VHTRLVCDSVPTTVIGDAEIDLTGIDITGPQKLQCLVDLVQVCMGPDLVAECRNISVPRAVKVIRQHVEPIDVSLDGFGVHGLQILILGGESN